MTAEYREGNDGQRYRQLVSADDVDDVVLKAAEETAEWFVDRPIDWEEFLDRMEESYLPDDYEIPSLDNPAVRKIKRHIREIRAMS